MGEANTHADTAHGAMDISEQKATFSAFIKASEWGGSYLVALVALLTVAFAMGAGWFPGLLAFAAVAALAGFLLKLGPAWWVSNGVLFVLMAIGGGVVSLFFPGGGA